jgi:6-phosphofructokinase 2
MRLELRVPDLLTLTLNPAVDITTTVERVVPVHKLRCAQPLVHPGGGGVNVARVAARLGADVVALHAAGGPAGDQLSRLLAAEHVAAEAIAIAGTTRENFTVRDAASGEEYRFVLPGPALSDPEWQACAMRCAALGGQTRYVVASGSLPPGVPADFYAQLASRLGGRSRLVLDSSGPALEAALAQGVYAFKPSLRELRQLTGDALETAAQQLQACRRLVHAGRATWVALSLGSAGAMLVTAQEAWGAGGLAVPVKSTIGAGDSFVAGLVCALLREATPEQALREAMAASSAAVQSSGTALCDAAMVEAMRQRVEVRRL